MECKYSTPVTLSVAVIQIIYTLELTWITCEMLWKEIDTDLSLFKHTAGEAMNLLRRIHIFIEGIEAAKHAGS